MLRVNVFLKCHLIHWLHGRFCYSAELILSKKKLAADLTVAKEALADKLRLKTESKDAKYKGILPSPYEYFKTDPRLTEEEKSKGIWSPYWFEVFHGTPIDAVNVLMFLFVFGTVRVIRFMRYWERLRRGIPEPGYNDSLPHIRLASLQQTAEEKSARHPSRWSLNVLALKYRITLDDPTTNLSEVYYRNEEHDAQPDPWVVLKSVIPWMSQYKRIKKENKKLLDLATKYSEKSGRSKRERAEMRETVFHKLKEIERGVPLTQREKQRRMQRMIDRDDLKLEARHRHENVKYAEDVEINRKAEEIINEEEKLRKEKARNSRKSRKLLAA